MAGTNGKPKRAAGYIRVSQVGGREGDSFLSPDLQRERIESWAAYKGIEVVEWFVDLDTPASKGAPPRRQFEAMMKAAGEGRFDIVAVARLTRFARSVQDAAKRYEELRGYGCDLVSTTEDFDTSTASGQLVQNLLFALAEFEATRIGEEWRAVHASRRRRGLAHAPRGRVFGYEVEGAVPTTVIEHEADAVRMAFELRSRGTSYKAIADELERHGHHPRGGERFPASSLSAMLTSPLYAGLVRADGELIKATHPAIVSRELFDRTLKAGSRASSLARHHAPSLLTGLLVCSGCGYRLVATTVSRGRPIYRCRPDVYSRRCTAPVSIARPAADDFIEAEFLARLDPSQMPNQGRIPARGQRDRRERVRKLRHRAEQLTAGLDRIAEERFVRGALAADEFDRQFHRFTEERAAVLEQAGELEALDAVARPLPRDVFTVWPTLDIRGKREVLRVAIENITVSRYDGPAGGARWHAKPEKRLAVSWLI